MEGTTMLLKVEGDRATLNTRATPPVLAILPRLEGRRSWLKGGGLVVENTPHNISILKSIAGVVLDCPEAPKSVAEAQAFDVGLGNPTYRPKTVPYDHQIRALSKIAGNRVFGLFMEQGTGKTKTLIDWAGKLFSEGKITGVLVVSKKGVHRQWIESEVPTHCGVASYGEYWPLKAINQELSPGAELKWLAFNYDGLKTPTGLSAAAEFCVRHRGRLLIIADESQEIKNHKSARSKAMDQLKLYSSHRALATGTPIAKDLTDEWAQLRWLEESIIGVRYITAFRAEYCIMGGFEGRSVIGHKNVEAFKRKVDPFTFRATKDEIGILPKQYSEWSFDLTKPQLALIKSLKDDLAAEIASGQIVSVATAAVAINKFQQIAGGFLLDEDGTVHRLMDVDKNPRAQAAMEWLDSGEGKAVIWARFREDMRILAEALSDAGVTFAQYHGGTNDKERAEAVKSFMHPEGVQVFLANPQSAGTGLNLQGLCNRALYYSNSFNAIDRWQSEDRIHRIGTVGAVTYTDLIGKRSTDLHIMRNLRQKKGISEMALGDVQKILSEL
jgi:hypothetical protein